MLTIAWMTWFYCWKHDVPMEEGFSVDVKPREADDFHHRRAVIEHVCSKYEGELRARTRGSRRTNKQYRRVVWCRQRECPMFIDDAHQFAYCLVSKVATTTVKSIFVKLLNNGHSDDTDHGVHEAIANRARRVGPLYLKRDRQRQNYTRALFVRHPFERFVSAYVDKALRSRSEEPFFYEHYWDSILGTQDTDRRVTFMEYADFVLSHPVRDADEHWAPYHWVCEPCLVEYDVVGKLETAERDFESLWSRLGIEVDHTPIRNNRRSGLNESVAYFSQLNLSTAMRLYEYYFYDFELFEYDASDYLRIFPGYATR